MRFIIDIKLILQFTGEVDSIYVHGSIFVQTGYPIPILYYNICSSSVHFFLDLILCYAK